MESKKSWNSCRLAPHGEAGRIRWRVGQESAWEWKLKVLIFVPLVLLSITALSILITYLYQSKNFDEPTTSHSYIESLEENKRPNEEKNILEAAQTPLALEPTKNYLFNTKTESNVRRK